MSEVHYDVVVVGAGSAGLPVAIAAADRGARVCLVEGSDEIGGTLPISRGQMSGAGTRRQAERGIEDSAQAHYDDSWRISRGTSDPDFLRLACELQGPYIDWLQDHGFEMHPDVPKVIHGHESYRTARTYWGVEDGKSILKVLQPMLDAHVAAGRIDVRLKAEADALVMDGARVVGVVAKDGRRFLGRSVVLTTGGYGSNPELFAELHDGAALGSGSHRTAQGAGLVMGMKAGGVIAHLDKYLPNFGGVLDHTLPEPRYRAPGGLVPQDRQPWEVVVNRQGERFYREDSESADERALLLQRQTGSQGWVIYDDPIRREAPSIFRYFTPEKAESFYTPEGAIVSAGSIRELAELAGVDADALERTVADYNRAVDSGEDRLGRIHMPRRIETPPFYALPIMSYAARSFAGLKTDTEFRVLNAQDKPVEGLYAVGEILGSLLSGNAGVGGMSLTPALAFGKYVGERLPIGAG
jgi:fumarate reductase flavoprotein subunit